jgi:hypothetical protein
MDINANGQCWANDGTVHRPDKNFHLPDFSEHENRAYGRHCTLSTLTYHHTTHETYCKMKASIFTYITQCVHEISFTVQFTVQHPGEMEIQNIKLQ